MKTCAVILLLNLGMCAAAFAHPLLPYVGAAMQISGAAEETVALPQNDVHRSPSPFPGMGIQLEGGEALNFCNAYVGFRVDGGGKRDYSVMSMVNYRFTAERFLVGARLHISDEYANPVKPLIGGAITYGWAQRIHELAGGNWQAGVMTEDHSSGAFGWLAEIGCYVKTRSPMYLSFLLRFESLNSQFGDQSKEGSVENVYQLGIQAGVIYQFNRGQ